MIEGVIDGEVRWQPCENELTSLMRKELALALKAKLRFLIVSAINSALGKDGATAIDVDTVAARIVQGDKHDENVPTLSIVVALPVNRSDSKAEELARLGEELFAILAPALNAVILQRQPDLRRADMKSIQIRVRFVPEIGGNYAIFSQQFTNSWGFVADINNRLPGLSDGVITIPPSGG